MNLNSVRSILKQNQEWVCFSCLLQCTSTQRWQQPFRRALSNKVILPAISHLAIAALHGELDKADRIKKSPDSARAARKAKSRARLSLVKRKIADAKGLKVDGEPKEPGSVLIGNDELVKLSEGLPPRGKADGKTKSSTGRAETPDPAGPPQSSKHLPSTKPKAIKREAKNGSTPGNTSVQSKTPNTAGSPQSSKHLPFTKSKAVKREAKNGSTTINTSGQSKTPDTAGSPQSPKHLPSTKSKAVKGEGNNVSTSGNASGQSKTPDTAGSSQSSKHLPSTKSKAMNGKENNGSKTENASGRFKTLDGAESLQSPNCSTPIESPAIKTKGKEPSKQTVRSVITAVSERSEEKFGEHETSITGEPVGESPTTTLERPPDVARPNLIKRVVTKDIEGSAAVRKVVMNTGFRRIAGRLEIVAPRVPIRKLTLKQRRQEALDRRRRLVRKTVGYTTKSLPQSDLTEQPKETLSMPTKTIREALLYPSSIDRVANETNYNGLSPYINTNDGWLDQITKRTRAKAVYEKNREKSDVIESGTEQRVLKSEIKHINAQDYMISALDIQQPAVPRLSYGLDRVLFNPGVYHLQDPRSRVFNFDPYLQSIMPVSEFDFTALKEYITSSRDTSLKAIAEEHGKRYVGSTSSMTGVLAHFHFLLSQWREINTKMMSRGFPDKLTSFTLIQRCPSAIFLRWKDGTYAIDADKEFATSSILSMLGKAMEKLLTLDTENFERYRKSNPDQLSYEERIQPEAFHYSTMGDFLMRSQLDAHDPRLPGTGMFDLKTRAVVAIRMDTQNPEQGSSYEIKERFGEYESFEREYFDMIRSAFLKYSLQVRMGRMDGIFVAFHNTERIFGFQYISLEEMDLALHGQSDTALGDQEFNLSLELLNQILDRATERFPEQSVRIHFETRDATTPFMYIFAEPVTEDEVNALQSRNQAKTEEFERELLGLHKEEDNTEEDNQWDDIQAKVEETMEKDERGEESSDHIVPSDRTSVVHEGQENGNDSTLTENIDYATPGANHESLNSTAITAIGDESEQDEVEDDSVSMSNNDQMLSEKEDVDDHLAGDDDNRNHLSEIEPIGENGITNELGIDATDPEAFAAQDDTPESLTNSSENEQTNSNSDEVEPDMPNPLEATPTPPDHSTLNPDTTSDSTDPPDFDSTADTTFLNLLSAERSTTIPTDHPPVLAMTLTIRNKVDGKYVLRPENIVSSPPRPDATASGPGARASPTPSTHGWSVEYTLTDVPDADRAWALYQACQARRRKKLEPEESTAEDKRTEWYVRRMRELNLRGREWRAGREREERGRETVVLGRGEGGC